MLEKRNVKNFYSKLFTINYVLETIDKNNKALEKEHVKRSGEIFHETNANTFTPSEKYILLNIYSHGMKEIVREVLQYMVSYNFSSISSVPSNGEKNNKKNQYQLLSTYSLYEHTINCAICAIDLANKLKLPDLIKETLVLLALLHDFGKEPTIAEKYKNAEVDEGKVKHNIYAKYFTKSFLAKHLNKNINKENYDIIIYVLENHHYYGVEETKFLKLLREADEKAREIEKEFALNRLEIKSKQDKEEAEHDC